MTDEDIIICTNPFDMSKPPKIVFDDENYDVIVVDTQIEDEDDITYLR